MVPTSWRVREGGGAAALMPRCYAFGSGPVLLVGRLPVGMGIVSDTAALGDRGMSVLCSVLAALVTRVDGAYQLGACAACALNRGGGVPASPPMATRARRGSALTQSRPTRYQMRVWAGSQLERRLRGGHLPTAGSHRPRTAQIESVWKACRSVAQALEHEGKGDTTGAEVVAHSQERAMPMPQPQHATWVPRVSIPPSVALPQPPTAQIGRACRRAGVLLRRSSTKGKAAPLVRTW